MKSKTNKMWHRICECNNIENLQPRYWEQLKKISYKICSTDFDNLGKYDTFASLLDALSYSNWEELKELSKLKHDLDFLAKCLRRADEKYDGKIYRLFTYGTADDESFIGVKIDKDSISKRFSRAMDDLKLTYKQNDKPNHEKIYLEDIVYYAVENDEGEEPTLVEIYYLLKNKMEATKLMKAAGLRKRK